MDQAALDADEPPARVGDGEHRDAESSVGAVEVEDQVRPARSG